MARAQGTDTLSWRPARTALVLLVAQALVPTTARAAKSASPAAPVPSAEASTEPPSKIAARAERSERRIEGERPTAQRKGQDEAAAKRASRIKLQIPERLRGPLQAKIDRRIAENVAESAKLRLEALTLLRKLAAETPKESPERPETLVRLAELEWEEARERFLTAFRRWENTPIESRQDPPDPDYSKARALFKEVLLHHKSYRDYDLALYVDGFLAQEEGKADESLGRFNLILAWFPKSRFVPDAHMVRAEYEFTKSTPSYENALAEYEKVLSYGDTELHDLALFKSAWTLWRLGRQDEAARRFLTVFQEAAQSENQAGARRAEIDELQREALRNLVTVFAEDEKNTAEDMYRFLKDAGGDKFAGRIVLALADTFYEQAQYERGIEAYRLLLRLEPTAPEAYRSALRVAQGHSTTEAWDKLAEDYRSIIQSYAPPPSAAGIATQPTTTTGAGTAQAKATPQNAAWIQAQTPETKEAAVAVVEQQLREDAVGLHAKAQADKSRTEYQAAAALYSVYLGRYGKSAAAYDMYFNAGEIDFYHLENAQGAASNYLAAVRLDPKNKLSRDALHNALTALEVARAQEFDAAKAANRPLKESPTDKKLTEAMELYIATYPDDKAVPDLLFRQGRLYYDYGVYDPAVRQWGLLLEKYPNSSQARTAGELILDSFNKSQDYENIEVWARRLKKAPAFAGAPEQKKLDVLIVGAVFKQGEQLAAAGQHGRAAAAYLRAAKEFPGEPRAAQAAVNAEVEAKRAADLDTLSVAANLLSEKFGDRPEVPQGLWIAATTYQEIGLFAEAAAYHEKIAARFPKDEHHKDAAFNAVLLRTTVRDHDLAIKDGEIFKQKYPRDPLAAEATFLMGKAHEAAEKWKDAEKLYLSYASSAPNPNRRIEAWVHLALVRKDDPKGRERALDEALKIHGAYKQRLDDQGRYYAAQARYMEGTRYVDEFETVKIEGDVKQLSARLKKKSQLLKKAADEFIEASKMGVAEWTTASLYQIGHTYESFSRSLLDSPAPQGLSPDDAELYRQSIDEFVVPIEERSIEAYESGWAKAVELGIFNEWTAKMRVALGRLSSEAYPPLEEVGFEVRSKGPLPLPPLIAGLRRKQDGTSVTYLMPIEKLDAGTKTPEKGNAEAKPGKAQP